MPNFTTNYQFAQPLVNDPTDADIWGGELNTNFGQLDSFLKTATDRITVTLTAATTLDSTYRNKLVLANAASAAFTLTLPDATATGMIGYTVWIKKTDASTNPVTIACSGTQTIDGLTTYQIVKQFTLLKLTSDGSNWQISSRSQLNLATDGAGILPTTNLPISTAAQAIDGDSISVMTPASVIVYNKQEIICECSFNSGTQGGPVTANAWNNRILNTKPIDDVGVTLNTTTGVLTVPIGTYKFRARSSAFYVGKSRIRLQDVTNNITLWLGLNDQTDTNTSNGAGDVAQLEGRFTAATQINIQLQHYVGTPGFASNGNFGQAASITGVNEVYGQLILEKIA